MGYVYFLGPDGKEKKKFETGDWTASSPAIARDGTVVVGSRDGYVYFLKPDGTEKAKFKTGGQDTFPAHNSQGRKR